jgi:hypothetical protein
MSGRAVCQRTDNGGRFPYALDCGTYLVLSERATWRDLLVWARTLRRGARALAAQPVFAVLPGGFTLPTFSSRRSGHSWRTTRR